MATERPNPYSNFNFVVFIGDAEVAAFCEVTGLDSENPIIEYREGADGTAGVRKIPGIETVSNVSLKRGITGSLTLWQWRKQVRDGVIGGDPGMRRDVKIKLLDETGDRNAPAMTWTLHDAWPTKITGPSLNAKGSEFAVEQLDLAHERLDIE